MKKILAILLAAALTLALVPVLAEENSNDTLPVPCMVTGDYVREREGPGTEYRVACKHRKYEVVDIISQNGEWWQLANGNYMSAKYLSPMCENDQPGVNVKVTTGVMTSVDGNDAPRLLGLVYGSSATREDLIANLHDFVLLKVSDQCIECYQEDVMKVRIKLTTSPLDIKFRVTPAEGDEYDIHSAEEIVNLIRDNSKDWTHFVVLP